MKIEENISAKGKVVWKSCSRGGVRRLTTEGKVGDTGAPPEKSVPQVRKVDNGQLVELVEATWILWC